MENKTYKIALTCDHFHPRVGGIELHVADLARELEARGHPTHIITPLRGSDTVGGIKVHRIPVPTIPKKDVIYNFKAFPILEKILRDENFNFLHAHSSIISPFSYGSLYVARKLKIPSALTTHSFIDAKNILLLKTLNYLTRWSKLPCVFTSISTAAAKRVGFLSGRKEIPILPNGIHIENWNLTPQSQKRLRITSVLRLSRRKRPLQLIRSIPHIVKNSKSNGNLRFTIIGDGPYRKSLAAEVKRLGLQDQVELLGYVSREKIKEVFQSTDIYVLPTKKEAFGLSVLEARCAGLPVVAMNYGGVRDLIDHEVNGLLSQNWREFSENIIRFIEDPELRAKCKNNAKIDLNKFSWERVIHKHLQLYQQASLPYPTLP